ncbi:hypothetical protein MMC12_000799 [Toensbergia leucococca]|nr:hypothetical protein [Toensbergia leucococca]
MSRLLKIRHNVAHVQRHDQQKARAFDQDSGQVYTEVLRHSGPMTSDWVRKTIGSTREVDSFRSRGPGCSSLVNMAIRNALTNILSITPESLREMPWEIGKRLWERILA